MVALFVSAESLPPCQRISLAPAPKKGVMFAFVASLSAAIEYSAPVSLSKSYVSELAAGSRAR